MLYAREDGYICASSAGTDLLRFRMKASGAVGARHISDLAWKCKGVKWMETGDREQGDEILRGQGDSSLALVTIASVHHSA